jgi:SNF2 family DNA or RNA helicase
LGDQISPHQIHTFYPLLHQRFREEERRNTYGVLQNGGTTMIILHGFWVPDAQDSIQIWGEDTTLSHEGEKPRGRRPKVPPVTHHPFAAGIPSVREELTRIGYPGEGVERSATILLPSSGLAPLSSLECAAERDGGAILAPFTVPLLTCPLAYADLAGIGQGSTVGATLQFWAAAVRFALDRVVQGSFLPSPLSWELLIKDGDTHEALLSAFPPACRIWAGYGGDTTALLSAFLNHTVHQIVTASVSDLVLLPPKRGRQKKIPPPEEAWIRLLGGEEGVVSEDLLKDTEFLTKIERWRENGRPRPVDLVLRGSFRLEEPEEEGERWQITFHLSSIDNPGLLIPADDIWRGRAILPSGAADAGDTLLLEIGRASRIYSDLRDGLKTARPTKITMDTGGAYLFLTDYAPLLIDAGYSVILPKWWKSTGSRTSVKVAVSKNDEESFGLESIVSYSWAVAIGDQTLTPEEFEELTRQKIPLVRMHGRWVSIDESEIEKAKKAFEKRFGTMTVADLLKISAGADPDLPVAATVEADGWMKWLVSGDGGVEPVQVPKTFQGRLRPYQEQGLSWLSSLTRRGLGACLADDMGLGKTIQVIAYLLAGKDEMLPALIICPTSLVGNWRHEVIRFAPGLSVGIHHGTSRDTALLGRYDLTITTYPLAVRDFDAINALSWKTIIIDEAQNIKNPQTKQAKAVRSLKSRHKIALTGTPVENRLTELWSIMEFLNPGYLGSLRAFQEQYAAPIERYRDPERTEELRSLIRPFIMRRMKTDRTIITDLPDKMEMKVYCSLTPEQASLYEAVVQELLEMVGGTEGIQRRGLVLGALMKLKQICNHPALFQKDEAPLADRSGKLTRLLEMLEEVLEAGERALIFTQFPSFGERLIDCITERFGVPVLFLHGKTPLKERDALVQRFQGGEGAPIFLLSLKAGGTGLNLTAANHVFHLDRWWNPAVEDQATDRAFRIGQTRDVQVRLMINTGTLEERIDDLIEGKKQLAGSVLGGGEDWIASLSDNELRDLLTLRKEAFS